MNHVGMEDDDLAWYSPSATHRIYPLAYLEIHRF